MNAVSKIAPTDGTNIVALVEATPVIVLTDREKYSAFYEAMKAECDLHVPDLTSEKGRKAISSLAYKVARTKTAIDDAGKKLNEEARARINAVDESRREIRAQLDALRDDVRRPLTDWEEAEKERAKVAAEELDTIRAMKRVDLDDAAANVAERIATLTAMSIDAAVHASSVGYAESLRLDAIDALTTAHQRLVREEEERAELARLREEAAARELRDERERQEREEAERQRRDAEEAEARRIAAEAAAAEAKAQAETQQRAREEAAAKAAAERAQAEAERKAREEREATERAHAEALAAEKRRADQAEAARKAEADRIAKEEAAAKAEAQQVAAEQARREADRAHRGKIMGEAKAAIISCGVDEQTAKAIVLAIAANNVPHISIAF